VRRFIKVILVLLIGIQAVAGVLWLLISGVSPIRADPAVVYVAPDCSGLPTPCYNYIQTAVLVADPGDEVRIAAGVYTNYGTAVVRVDVSLTLRGGYSADFTRRDPLVYPTILDAEGERRGIYVGAYTGESITVTLDGLHVVNGNAAGLRGEPYTSNDVGGGLYATNAAITVENCSIGLSAADQGGGLYLLKGNALISNTRVYSNTAAQLDGGGIYLWEGELTLQECVISGNVAASMGGGAYLSAHAMTLSGNDVYSNTSSWGGGGLLIEGAYATLSRNRFYRNGVGGGLFCWNCVADLVNNVATANEDYGIVSSGGLLTLRHTTISDNRGTGLATRNSGQLYGRTRLTNTIISGNEIGVHVEGLAAITLTATLWWNNVQDTYIGKVGGESLTVEAPTYTADPTFADAPTGDYHLRPLSPAVNRGIEAGVHSDVDGDSRPWGPAPDLGADEYLPRPPESVAISGPTFGLTDGGVALDALVSPATAMVPITYIWQATGQPSVTHVVSDVVDRIVFTWRVTGTNFYPVTGSKHITVVASNGYGSPVWGFHTLVIEAARTHVYLPLVVRAQ